MCIDPNMGGVLFQIPAIGLTATMSVLLVFSGNARAAVA